jgi:hypothetical protein
MTRRIRPVDLSQLVIGQRLKPQTIVESRTFPADVQFGYDFGMLVRSQAQNEEASVGPVLLFDRSDEIYCGQSFNVVH